jgi:ABC-type nickel/cobalt efflux system permease component RcnA
LSASRKLDLVWLALITLTLAGAALGETAEPGLWITISVAAMMVLKGRMVIDHFMELGHANPGIRRMVRLYGVTIPLLLILTYLFGPQIAAMTSL